MQSKPIYTRFKDCHKGESGIIIANGPSLRDVPIEYLMSMPTFGCNYVHMLGDFAPTYYANIGVNHLDTEEKRASIFPAMARPNCKAAFINRLFAHYFPFEDVVGIMSGSVFKWPQRETRKFRTDPLDYIGVGGTMLFGLFQIAYYMGFDKVYVVGLDHDYEGKEPHFYSEDDVPFIEAVPGPVYDYDNERWQARCDGVFTMCRIAYEDDGRRIINITPGSKCDVFEKGAPEW